MNIEDPDNPEYKDVIRRKEFKDTCHNLLKHELVKQRKYRMLKDSKEKTQKVESVK